MTDEQKRKIYQLVEAGRETDNSDLEIEKTDALEELLAEVESSQIVFESVWPTASIELTGDIGILAGPTARGVTADANGEIRGKGVRAGD